MAGWRRPWMAALLVSLLMASGCSKSQDLLLLYSGDCQGYLDPCG
jgi:hypothetical protein